jgi:hypothetical protein
MRHKVATVMQHYDASGQSALHPVGWNYLKDIEKTVAYNVDTEEVGLARSLIA